jgi:hypothetical protein
MKSEGFVTSVIESVIWATVDLLLSCAVLHEHGFRDVRDTEGLLDNILSFIVRNCINFNVIDACYKLTNGNLKIKIIF